METGGDWLFWIGWAAIILAFLAYIGIGKTAMGLMNGLAEKVEGGKLNETGLGYWIGIIFWPILAVVGLIVLIFCLFLISTIIAIVLGFIALVLFVALSILAYILFIVGLTIAIPIATIIVFILIIITYSPVGGLEKILDFGKLLRRKIQREATEE